MSHACANCNQMTVVVTPPDRRPAMKVVVTGGAGFIGATCAGPIVADGRRGRRGGPGRPVDRTARQPGGPGRRDPGRGIDPGSGRPRRGSSAGAAAVVHLAARRRCPDRWPTPWPATSHATGTMQVLEAARPPRRPPVIVASSSSVYGANPTLPSARTCGPAVSPYAASKLAAESSEPSPTGTRSGCRCSPSASQRLRPLQPADHPSRRRPAFPVAAARGQPLVVHGDGGQTRTSPTWAPSPRSSPSRPAAP